MKNILLLSALALLGFSSTAVLAQLQDSPTSSHMQSLEKQ